MPCFEHPKGLPTDSVPAGTSVHLPKKPKNPTSPVRIYHWAKGDSTCKEHSEPAEPNFEFTHKAKLARTISGFVTAGICRGSKKKLVLYVYAGSGADLTAVTPDDTPVCDG